MRLQLSVPDVRRTLIGQADTMTAAQIVASARATMSGNRDNKVWALHNEMATLLAAGAERVGDYGSRQVEIIYGHIRFLHVCNHGPGNSDVCGLESARFIC